MTQFQEWVRPLRASAFFGAWAVSLLLAFGAPQAQARADWIDVGPEREVRADVDEGTTLELQLPPGELSIRGTDGSMVTGRMQVRCHDDSTRCAEELEDFEFTVTARSNRVTIGTNKRMKEFRFPAEITLWLEVPRVRRLNVEAAAGELTIRAIEAEWLDVNLKAGELNLADVAACPRVRLLAGEARVSLPESLVASVDLDAGVGDVSMHTSQGYHHGKRTWMVGSEIEWDQGSGSCDLSVDVQAGEIKVDLTN